MIFNICNVGSYLIQYLCSELRKEYLSTNQKRSLEDVLKQVQSHINNSNIFVKLNPEIPDEKSIEVKQTIESRVSLRDCICFKKAETPGKEKNILLPPPAEDKNWLTEVAEWFKNFIFESKKNWPTRHTQNSCYIFI